MYYNTKFNFYEINFIIMIKYYTHHNNLNKIENLSYLVKKNYECLN